MTDVAKVRIEFEQGRDTVLVEKIREDGGRENFRVSEDTLRNLFSNRYSTGYFSVTLDGPVYIEEREGVKVVVIQRGFRENQLIKWNDHTIRGPDGKEIPKEFRLNTPWTYFIYRLEPASGGYTRAKETVYVGTGSCLGSQTKLYSAEFLGNIYPPDRSYFSNTNICWGSTAGVAGGVVTLATLTNLANDFFVQVFTNHVERSIDRWQEFSRTSKMFGTSQLTLGEAVDHAWNKETKRR